MPEVLSGCRKAPILAVGINPNLPGWWPWTRSSLNPLFDDYRQYAHYFRYRAIDKLQVPDADYRTFGGGPQDTPFSDFELEVPVDPQGRRTIPVEVQPVTVYETYQALLDAVADRMGGARTGSPSARTSPTGTWWPARRRPGRPSRRRPTPRCRP